MQSKETFNIYNDDILDEFLDQRVYESYASKEDGEYLFNDPDPHFDNQFHDLFNSEFNSQISSQLNSQSNSQSNSPKHYLIPHSLSPNTQGGTVATGDFDVFGNRPQFKSKGDLSDFDSLRDEISKLQFGKYHMNFIPHSISPAPEILDFSPMALSDLPYKLTISNLPDYSRVETQIKISLKLSPSPFENLLHLPQDLISKNKFCLSDDLSTLNPIILKNLLYLDCFVMTSNLKKSCNICSKCIKREQKRASRRRLGSEDQDDGQVLTNENVNGIIKNNPNTWANEKMIKKAIFFNCKEIVSFPPPTGLSSSKSIDLSARLICYCRHHQETEGFKLFFVVKNYKNEIVAKQLSSSIMIMDRKKPNNPEKKLSVVNTAIATPEPHPLSPNSLDESSDLITETQRKRKKLSIDDSNNYSNNPMFNGPNGFSPLSNSDTNTSINKLSYTKSTRFPSLSNVTPSLPNAPTILRIIPAQGPIRGGIEVTLLGYNFNSSLAVKFGANSALATHCWSETTIVTYLPPSAQPGQVLVSFENHEDVTIQNQQIFTYTDDTDKQLIELALQIVGLKMNGKLEDAKNIARRIVDSGSNPNSQRNSEHNTPQGFTSVNVMLVTSKEQDDITSSTKALEDWYNSAQGIVEKLTKQSYSTEEVLVNFLKLVDLPNCPIIIPNWHLANAEGQTLLHLATFKSYHKLVKFLINHGCTVDLRDNQGLNPLFYAGINGDRDLITLYLDCNSSIKRLTNNKTIKDYCDLNVLDMFENIEDDKPIGKAKSIDSLSSLLDVKGLHISKMVTQMDNNSELADSEFSEADDVYDLALNTLPPAQGLSQDMVLLNQDITRNVILNMDNDSDSGEATEVATIVPGSPVEDEDKAKKGLWQKVKDVFNNYDDELPSYDDLFPFGESFSSKPKITVERQLGELSHTSSNNTKDVNHDSDSSEDLIISYINHPRKPVENDKMLIFFWLPMLVLIMTLFISISLMGYKIETVEYLKTWVRSGLGNLMVGSDRLKRVFDSPR